MLCFPGLKFVFQFLVMDAAVTGALIGIGMMGCLVCTVFCYEKAKPWSQTIREKYLTYRQQRQPLLPISQTNPLIVTQKKHFEMKKIITKK